MADKKSPQSAGPPPPPDGFAFSPDGELFAAVADRRVQVWRTRGGQMIAGWTDPVAAPDDSYSCIACCSVQKKHKKDGNVIIVVVGTTNGQVLAIDSTGVIWKSACHTGKVVSLHFSKHGRVIYTAGTDGVICELNSRTGESKDTFKASKKSINYMTISHDEKFMGVSSKTTRLFSVHDKKEILKIPSAGGPIQLMSVSDDARFLVSSIDNNKEVQICSCDHDSCSIVSTASLAMQTQPKTVECTRSTSYEGGGIVLAVSKKGVAYVWHLQTLSQGKVLPTKISVKNSLDRKGRIPIISAKLCDVKEDNTIKVHVVFGPPDCLQFKAVELGETCKDINLVAEYDALALKDMLTSQQRNVEQDAKVNSRESGEPDLQEITNPTHQGRAKKRTASVLDSTNGTTKGGNPEYNLDEPTMEEKLASLNLLSKSESTKEQSSSMAPPSADSVHILLKQALRADDHAELLKCLYNRDEKVIVKSISLLTPADVVKLLKFFVLQIQSRGATLVCLLPWLQTLLSRHMSSIVSQESSVVLLLNFKSKPNVWAYFSVKSGGAIHEFSDSQFGHVFAFGESRSLAIANMVLGLKEIQIRGEIRTNVDYTVDLLNAAEYRENKIHTGWLDSRIAMRVRAERPPWYLSVVGGALYEASSRSSSVVTDYVGYLSKGQIPPKHISLVNLTVTLNIEGSKYTIETVRGGPRSYKLRMNGSEIEAEIHSLRDGGLLMQLDGNSHVIYAETEAAGTRLLINGRTCLLQKEHDPSKLLADTSCKLLRFLVVDGSHVDADTPYAEVEVMKMCMPLLLPASGVIHFVMPEGQAMQANDLIARLDLDDPSSVRRAEPFHGTFPKLGPPTAVSGKVHQKFAASVNSAHMILAGYEHNINEVVQDLLNCLDNPELPFLQWQELMSVLATRLPKDLRNELDGKYKEYELNPDFQKSKDFPAKLLRGVIEANLAYCSEKDRVTNERLVEPLMSLVKSYEGGRESHARVVVKSLFEEYLSVEELFSDNIQSDVIERLRLQHAKDLEKVVHIVFSHQGVRNKNKLILRLMEALVYPNPSAYRDQLIRFSALNHTAYSQLALKASQLLEHTKLSELRTSIARRLSELEMFTEEGELVSTPRRKMAINERMEDLVCAPLAVEDALVALFDHSDPTLQRRVVETYIRRLYQPYLVRGSIRMQWHRSGLIALWEFSEEHMEQRNALDVMSLKQQLDNPIDKRWGVMVVIKSLQFLSTAIEAALKESSHYRAGVGDASNGNPIDSNNGNMLHIALVGINNQLGTLQDSGDEDQAQERINKLSKILKDNTITSHLNGAGVRVVSCIIQRDEGRPPMRHSFQWSVDKLYYEEDPMLRHVEPPLSTFLELDKVNLEGYNEVKYTPSRDRQWHIYTLVKNKKDQRSNDQRMFLRTIVRQPSATNGFLSGGIDNEVGRAQASSSFTSNSILRSLMAALEEIELHAHNEAVRSGHSHMYLCILREQQLFDLIPFSRMTGEVGQDEATASTLLKHMVLNMYEHVGVRMHRLSVCQWEVKLWLDCDGQANGAWRVVVTNVTGHTCTVDIYREVEDSNTHQLFYHSATPTAGPLHGVALHEPYKPLDAIDLKRYSARKNETTYCYDFPLAFETALKKSWKSSISGVAEANEHNRRYAKVTELIFANSTGAWGTPLVPVERPPGVNDIGIVAWSMKLSTPEFPGGRKIIVVANDVTFKAGSFGPREDAFFDAVTNLACERKLPLIYLSATAGARLGVAEEIKSCFHVGWFDDQSPERGFHYIYLTEQDYSCLSSSVIARELKLESGETRWVVDTIVGKEDGLGCENLHGSGAIASAYSKAYRETFTLTFVTGRAVGIGAYLARLGMRCIQRLDQPIILTGFSALNKLLGREVYSSHMQLGGPKIMATNGVVHLTVSDDLEGVSAILKWLSYVPPYVGGPLPIMKPLDPPDRPVTYFPENSCDARAAICGIQDSQGKWLGGMFDKESFVETLEGWAKTVITGRAKLGGIPVGVIAVETQTMMQVIPADPGQLDSAERVVPQAGQVWFPDSATKTAQALLDFNCEELPLFILANWRGFSGGQRDLFEGILQAGSTIVENLRTYKQPAFVYIPMAGELRGGAWVVVDSKINPDHIEMYAERTAKGNVLEPEGLVEIKFRPKELEDCMLRLDPELIGLNARLKEMKKENASLSEMETIRRSMTVRMKQLVPIYTQVATRFAELHDTSARMAAKGVIGKVVDWEESRAFFYRRLRRRVAEDALAKEVREAAGEQLSHKSALESVKNWYLASKESEGDSEKWNDDEAFFAWKDDPKNYENHLEDLKAERVSKWFSHLAESSDVKALPNGLSILLGKMDPSKREQVLDGLRQLLG